MPESKHAALQNVETHTAESVRSLSGEELLNKYDDNVRASRELLSVLNGDEVKGDQDHPKYKLYKIIAGNAYTLRAELESRLRDKTVH